MSRKQAAEGATTAMDRSAATQEREVEAKSYDAAATADRMSALREKVKAQKEADKQREAKLAEIAVDASDVALLAKEFGWTAVVATKRLREKKGDVRAVLKDAVLGKYHR